MISIPQLLPDVEPSTLPSCTPDVNPDLLLLLIDVGVDYLTGLIASIAVLVIDHQNGTEISRHSAISLPSVPLANLDDEANLLADFIREVADLVQGAEKSFRPLHVAYYDEITPLLNAIWRHLARVPEAAAMYDVLTLSDAPQSPEAPGATSLASEVERYCHTITFPSLQYIAIDMGYRWDARLRRVFREGVFDGITRDGNRFRVGRARSSSKAPLEYYYAAWSSLPARKDGGHDAFAPYRRVHLEDIEMLLKAKLDAMSYLYRRWNVAGTVNRRLRPRRVDMSRFILPLGEAAPLADALTGFLRAERVAHFAKWKAERRVPAERRVLQGNTLIVQYQDANQGQETRQRNRSNRNAADRGEKWTQDGMTVRLQVSLPGGIDPDALEHVLLSTRLTVGDRVIISPLRVVDERLPMGERRPHQPSPEQLLYAARGEVIKIEVSNGASWLTLTMRDSLAQVDGYLFPSSFARPFEDGKLSAIDPDPNDGFGQQQSALVRDIHLTLDRSKPGYHTLYHWLSDLTTGEQWQKGENNPRAVFWSELAQRGQKRYFDGLKEAHSKGLLSEEYDDEDAVFVGCLGPHEARIVIAHGPPGCGKSLRAAHAILARLQGALAQGDEMRVYLSAPTHGAVDALVEKVLSAQAMVARLRKMAPEVADYFDDRLPELPLFRVAPQGAIPDRITVLPKAHNQGARGRAANADVVLLHPHAVVAGTPGGIYGMFRGDRWLRERFHEKRHAGLVILDEAARMGITEALMATLPLWPGGQVLLCGDHLQFSPIHAIDWNGGNPPRVPRLQSVHQSVFDFVRRYPSRVPQVVFTRTHRCNATIAAFLRRTFYENEGIALYSTRTDTVPARQWDDQLVAAILSPDSPITLVVHDEAESERVNHVEVALTAHILNAVSTLRDEGHSLGVGVVASHRAQRSLLVSSLPAYANNVGTVDAMQGAQFDISILVCTESDADYIRSTNGFVHTPQRLNVAVSRAKLKSVVVASRAVLTAIGTESSDGLLAFQSLRRTCNRRLWIGQFHKNNVEVWGS